MARQLSWLEQLVHTQWVESSNLPLATKNSKHARLAYFYCIGKIEFFFDISVFITIFAIQQGQVSLGCAYLRSEMLQKCVESSAFANAHLSYLRSVPKIQEFGQTGVSLLSNLQLGNKHRISKTKESILFFYCFIIRF